LEEKTAILRVAATAVFAVVENQRSRNDSAPELRIDGIRGSQIISASARNSTETFGKSTDEAADGVDDASRN
jgi:hypothetical protein